MAITRLILHEQTAAQVAHFLQQPAQALLLAAADGMGKTALAEYIIQNALGMSSAALAAYPYFLRVSDDAGSISIEKIRELQRALQLRTPGIAPLRRAVLVEHANLLTTEAQNAYLKILEEPPADTLTIFTTTNPRNVLPTIASRMQHILVHAPSEAQLAQLASDAARVSQAYLLSGGRPGLMHALLTENENHPLRGGVVMAKEILQKTPFERLAMAEALAKQKETLAAFIEALVRMAQVGLAQAARKNDRAKLLQWHTIHKLALQTSTACQKNANSKLAITNLFLHL